MSQTPESQTPSQTTPEEKTERWIYLGRMESRQKRGKLLQMFMTLPEDPKEDRDVVLPEYPEVTDGVHLYEGLISGISPGAVFQVTTTKGGSSVFTSGTRAPKLVGRWWDEEAIRAYSARDYAVHSASERVKKVKHDLSRASLREIVVPLARAYRMLNAVQRTAFLVQVTRMIVEGWKDEEKE